MFCRAREWKIGVKGWRGSSRSSRTKLLFFLGAVMQVLCLGFSFPLFWVILVFEEKAVKLLSFWHIYAMEGIYVYPIFLFKIASQSLLPCVAMGLLYVILPVFIVLMMMVLYFLICVRVWVSERESLIIFIFLALLSKWSNPLSICWKKKNC